MKSFSEKYLKLLTGKFASLNLTRITEEDEFYHKQIVDSVFPIQNYEHVKSLYFNSELAIDIGFGGGFPLLPLAYLLPEKKFYGFEARRKKADAVREIAKDLDINNVQTFHERSENVFIDRPSVVSLKAVGKIRDYLDKIYCVDNCHIIFYKGPNVDELEDVPKTYKGYNLVLRESYDVKGTDGRVLLVYKSKNVPRGTKKDLVKVTTL